MLRFRRRASISLAALAALIAASGLHAQSTRQDTLAIRIAQIRSLLGPEPGTDVRIWMLRRVTGVPPFFRPPPRTDPLTESEASDITETFPGTRLIDGTEGLILCPEGVQLRMPTRGCPIQDDGVIISLSPLEPVGDSVRSVGTILRSYRRPQRRAEQTEYGTAAAHCLMFFIRRDSGWQLSTNHCGMT